MLFLILTLNEVLAVDVETTKSGTQAKSELEGTILEAGVEKRIKAQIAPAYINGMKMSRNVIIYQGRILAPPEVFKEDMGAEVKWDPERNTVTITKGKISIRMTPGVKRVFVNKIGKPLDIPPIVIDNEQLMIPLRFVSEQFGYMVNWVDRRALLEERPKAKDVFDDVLTRIMTWVDYLLAQILDLIPYALPPIAKSLLGVIIGIIVGLILRWFLAQVRNLGGILIASTISVALVLIIFIFVLPALGYNVINWERISQDMHRQVTELTGSEDIQRSVSLSAELLKKNALVIVGIFIGFIVLGIILAIIRSRRTSRSLREGRTTASRTTS